MEFLNPWDNIKIRLLTSREELQYFDTRIHIIFVLIGSVEISNENNKITLSKDDFYILAKTEKYIIKTNNKSKVFYFTLDYFSKNENERFIYAFKGDSINKPRATDGELIYDLKQLLLMRTIQNNNSFSAIYKQYFTLIATLEKYYQIEVRNTDSKNIKDQIEDLKFYIDNNFEKEIRLIDLADQLFVTEHYLSRIFKEQTGMGISEYLIRRRLAKVRQLLLETEDSVTDIAFSAGFSNINSFNRLFKKYQGMTPSEYRYEVKKELKIKTKNEGELAFLADEELKKYLQEDEYSPEIRTVKVNDSKPLPFNMEKLMINLGYASDLLHGNFVKTMKQTIPYTSFKYGRIWGLLSDAILRQKDNHYDFSKVDEIIQNILDLGLTPFLDLGFKGKQIHESVTKIVSAESFELPYRSMDLLLDRYQALMKHLSQRFGLEEVSEWMIEIWKPNSYVLETIKNKSLAYWTDGESQLDITSNQDYFYFFEKVKVAIQQILPDIQIGGSGITLDLEDHEYQRFLEEWSRREIHPDFISFSVFSFDTLKESFYQNKRTDLISSDSHFLKNSLKRAKTYLDYLNFTDKMIVSEFNVTNSSRDLINDSAYKGPYILKSLFEILDFCDIVGYWQLSDQSFATFDVNNKEIFGGSGLISKNNIPKPSFYAFDFLAGLGNQLLYMSDGIIITMKKNKLMILCYHYSHLNNLYYYATQEKFNKTNLSSMFEDDGLLKLNFEFTDIFKHKDEVKVTTRKMGVCEGAFIKEANQLSLEDSFTRSEIDYLQKKCIPQLQRYYQKVHEGILNLQVELSPHDMLLIEVY